MQERGLADHGALLDEAADPDADAGETRIPAGQFGGHLREQVGDLGGVVTGQGPVVAGDDLAPEGGDDAVDHVLGDLEADEGPGLGDHVEGLRGAPLAHFGRGARLGDLDQQARLDERFGQPGEAARGEVETAGEVGTRQRAVDEHLDRHRALAGAQG